MSLPPLYARVLLPLVAGLAVIGLTVWWLTMRIVTVPMATVHAGTLPEQVHGTGTLQARVATTIPARVAGRIAQLYVEQGQHVSSNTLLATLDTTESRNQQHAARAAIIAAQHQTVVAQAVVDQARTAEKRAVAQLTHLRTLFRQGLVAKTKLDTTIAAEDTARASLASARATLKARLAELAHRRAELDILDTKLSYTQVTAPFAGLVARRYADPGQTVAVGTPLFRLIDPTSLWVVTRVNKTRKGLIQIDQPARVRLRTGTVVKGWVKHIGLKFGTTTRELEVGVALTRIPKRYTIGEHARVVIRAGQAHGAVFPASAVLRRGNRFGVLRVSGGRAVYSTIRLGAIANGKAVAISGLKAGTRIITRPTGIKPGTPVKPTRESTG